MNTLLDSLATSLFGMLVVFLALVSLIVMVAVIGWFLKFSEKQKANKTAAAKAAASEQAAPAPVVSAAPAVPVAQTAVAAPSKELYSGPMEVRLFNVEEKTAAIIMAIVCDACGIPANELYFKSIKALD